MVALISILFVLFPWAADVSPAAVTQNFQSNPGSTPLCGVAKNPPRSGGVPPYWRRPFPLSDALLTWPANMIVRLDSIA